MKKSFLLFIMALLVQACALAQTNDINALKAIMDKYTNYEKDQSNEISRYSNLKLTVKDCSAMYEVDETFSVYTDKEYSYPQPHKSYSFNWKNVTYIKRINSGTLLIGLNGKFVKLESKGNGDAKAERSKVCYFEIYFKTYTQGKADDDSVKAIELIKKIVKECGGREVVVLGPLDKVRCDDDDD